ncbi:MAG TPA: cation:proton antiporter [Gammaproteobacteria bacterium]|nr:cation:proton antiporter [Gammaproteobacteria bacterium]
MQAHTFFLYLLIILLTARIFAELAVRMKSPSVIGELFAGIVIGPSLFGWIQPVEALKLMAEIGIILLLFEVGLETDVRRLINSGSKSVVVAVIGFFTPLLLGYAISYYLFDLSLLVSLFIGGTLTATSIGITIRVLKDIRFNNSSEGQIVLGAAVIDDVLGVVLLALLYEFSTSGGINWVNTGKVIIFVISFFVLAPLMAKLISVIIRHFNETSEIPGLLPTTIVSLVLFFAWLAHAVGAPELLGGFAAGIALSRRFFLPLGTILRTDESFARTIEEQMQPIISLFTPIFFVVVGLSINLRAIDWGSPDVWIFSLLLLLTAIAGKLIGPLFIRENNYSRLMIGMSMIPRGEVGLIFAELGRLSNIFNNQIHAALVIVIVLTTIIPPFTMKWFFKRYSHKLLTFNP